MTILAEDACCSCECLLQHKDVTSLKNSATKFKSGLWQHVKNHASKHNPEVCFDTLWVCQFCRVLVNKDKLPSWCVLNGLESEPIPAELWMH